MSDLLESVMSELDKEIGKNSEAQAVTRFIDTGYPPLNKIISGEHGGGLPFGRLIEVFGESSSGKTALATQWMVNAQSMGGVAIFIDWERSFDVDMAQQMGLNIERPYWIYLRPRTWEEGNMQATKAAQIIRDSKVVDKDAPIIAVFDSIASAIPQSSAGKTIDELNMNDTSALARVTSTTLKVQAQYAADFDATFVYLNQVREKIGVMFGDKTCLRGDVSIPFVDGTSDSIENIVNGKIDKEVWSFNEKSGIFEPKKIIGWNNNGQKSDDVEWIHIRTNGKDTKNGVMGGTFTGDHLLLTENSGWKRADEITTSDRLVSKKLKTFSNEAGDFLMGVINFDCSLATRSDVSTTASIVLTDNTNPDYCEWKVKKLSNHLEFKRCDFIANGKKLFKLQSQFTSELKELTKFHRNPGLSFENGMTDMQLAIMIMDDGTFASQLGVYSVSIRRLSGNVDEIDKICNIFGKMGLGNSTNYGCGKFTFTVEASKKIADRICRFVPDCMQYKLPNSHKGMYQDFEFFPESRYEIDYVNVLEVKNRTSSKRSKYSLTYDLTVEGNHNYVAGNCNNGFVVHNCTPGGKAMEFYASVRMSLSRTRIMEDKGKRDEKEMIGQNITIKCMKSKLTAPFKTCKLRLSFDEFGMATFDTITSLVDHLIDKKLLDGGNWVVFDGIKHQGRKNLVKYVKDNGKMDDLLALLE